MSKFDKEIVVGADLLPTLHVIYRCCDSVDVCSASKRCFPVSKKQLISRCLDSIRPSVENAPGRVNMTVDVVEDCCSQGTLQKIQDTFSGVSLKIYNLDSHSNAKSFVECVKIATQYQDEDAVLFLEDDYLGLHDDVFWGISYGLNQLKKLNGGHDVAIHPSDYTDRYKNSLSDRTRVACTDIGHFLLVQHSTCTFATYCGAVKQHVEQLNNFRFWPRVGEDQSVNLLWKTVPLFQPIPGWMLHAQLREIMPPYLDYMKLDEYLRS